jgi:hypothetical protein
MTTPDTTLNAKPLKLFIFDEVVDMDSEITSGYYFGQMVILAADKADAILIYHEELDKINSEATPQVEITEKPLVRGLVTMVA